jgi:hypothetical protein
MVQPGVIYHAGGFIVAQSPRQNHLQQKFRGGAFWVIRGRGVLLHTQFLSPLSNSQIARLLKWEN